MRLKPLLPLLTVMNLPEQMGDFPSRIALNGADYFCLQIDRLMRQASGKGNVCVFVVTLPERIRLKDLQQHFYQRPAYQWLCRLRLQRGLPFSIPQWIHQPQAELPAITEYAIDDEVNLLVNGLTSPHDICKQSPFNITLLHSKNAGSKLVFTWHHVLMDAHGGELFIRHLTDPNLPSTWLAPEATRLPLKERAAIASSMKQFLYDTASVPLLSLYKKTKVKPVTHYRVIQFTPAQTQMIAERARQCDAGFLVSAFYLAATACAIAQVQSQRAPVQGDVLVPVPLDLRKRGSPGAIIGNQVSFLFYLIPNAMLSDVAACTHELLKQMKNLMRNESPNHYAIMLDFLRRMPGFLYRRQLKSPTKGLMASFFYSDTGDSLQDFDDLLGQSIQGICHYPPNLNPPGLTFIFSRFKGALQITLGYVESGLTPDELECMLIALQNTLLGE